MIQNPLAASMVQKPMQSAALNMNPQMALPEPPKNALMQAIGGGLNSFRKSFDPEGYKAGKDEAKAAEGDKLKQTLALMQQQRALPETQRGQWWQQNAPTISKIIGQDVSQVPVDVSKFSDQALDGQIAALSAQAGIGPVVPEAYTLASGAERRGANNEVVASNPIERAPRAPIIIENVAYDPVTYEPIITGDAKPENLPEGMWRGEDGKGPPQPIPGYVGMRAQIAAAGRAPSESGSLFRLASPQEVAAAGLPPGTVMKVNAKTNEPTILRNPSQTKEYDPVQIRQFKKSVSGLDLLNTTMDEYEATLKKSGGPQNIKGFWNVEQSNAIEAARNNTLVLAKELYELGALVGADFAIIEAAIKPATGIEASGQTNETIAASLAQVRSMLANKMSQIPEEFVAEVRNRYSGPMAKKFNATKPKATTLPPGVTQEMWKVMDDEDKAAFEQ